MTTESHATTTITMRTADIAEMRRHAADTRYEAAIPPDLWARNMVELNPRPNQA